MKAFVVLEDEGEYGYLVAGRVVDGDPKPFGRRFVFLTREAAEAEIRSRPATRDPHILETEAY